MPTNQKYSGRVHTRRQLVSIDTHLTSSIKLMTDIGLTYAEALPQVSIACNETVKVLVMVSAMVTKIRDSI